MVQRKEVNNKHLGIKPTINSSLKTENKQTNTKLTLQNHDTNSKVADFKAIKMKKSRSIKLSDSEVSQRALSKSHVGPQQPGKPPPRVTPNCKKASPNYMKSTNSSEARKEKTTQTTKRNTILSTTKVHKVVKTLTKTCSFKKIRTLTKVPSFKPIKTSTCSSTLKDSKFPPYLELNPGSTESEGKSKLRVCSFNHCSLNNQPHNSPPPLKRFISLRRLQLKSHKVNRPEILSPRKRKFSSECKTPRVVNPVEDFLVDLLIQDKEVDTQVSEKLSDGPRSEIDSIDNLDRNEDAESSDMNKASFGSDLEVNSPSVSSEEFGGNSDIEWEEGKTYPTSDNVKILTESHCCDDQSKPDFETDNSFGEYLEESHKYPPYFQDEIVEFLCYSDACSLADSEFTNTGKEIVEGPVLNEKDEFNSSLNNEVPEENSTPAIKETIYITKLEDESDVEQGSFFLNLFEEVKEVENEDISSYKDSLEFDGDRSEYDNFSNLIEEVKQVQIEDVKSQKDLLEFDDDRSDEDNCMAGEIREENEADYVKKERELIAETINNAAQISENSESLSTKRETCKGSGDGQKNSSEVKLHSHDDNVVEEKISDLRENDCTEVDEILETMKKSQNPTKRVSNNGESYTIQELLENYNKLRMVMRRKKEDDIEEEREFNPRGPNFLDIEPDPDAEKVDLRHQEMDDRRNAEEWMIDYALQKRVNQLALARKKKVELLVEAFEAVLPIAKYES